MVGKTNILDIRQSNPSRSDSELTCRVEIDTAGISFVRNGADHLRNPHAKQALIVTLTLDGSWKITNVQPS